MPGAYRLFLPGRSTCTYRGYASAKACISGSNGLDLWPITDGTNRQLVNLAPASGKNVSIVGTNVTMINVCRTADGCSAYASVGSAANCAATDVAMGTEASVGATAWEIQWVPGQPGYVYITNAVRSASCLKRYLGSSANCSSVTLGLFSNGDGSALTQWQLYKV